jgi:hypothetical protein
MMSDLPKTTGGGLLVELDRFAVLCQTSNAVARLSVRAWFITALSSGAVPRRCVGVQER